jgi:hypothetical protein
VEAGARLDSQALGNELYLIQDLVTSTREDVLEHTSDRLQVLVDVIDR